MAQRWPLTIGRRGAALVCAGLACFDHAQFTANQRTPHYLSEAFPFLNDRSVLTFLGACWVVCGAVALVVGLLRPKLGTLSQKSGWRRHDDSLGFYAAQLPWATWAFGNLIAWILFLWPGGSPGYERGLGAAGLYMFPMALLIIVAGTREVGPIHLNGNGHSGNGGAS